MKKGYWVAAYRSISDESAPKAYAELAMPALQPFGARFLTRRSKAQVTLAKRKSIHDATKKSNR
jgi:uncharacterized protein (DUF1330 family)